MLLTLRAYNKSFGVEDDDSKGSRTEWQVELLISAVLSIPRTSNDLRASYASSKLVGDYIKPNG